MRCLWAFHIVRDPSPHLEAQVQRSRMPSASTCRCGPWLITSSEVSVSCKIFHGSACKSSWVADSINDFVPHLEIPREAPGRGDPKFVDERNLDTAFTPRSPKFLLSVVQTIQTKSAASTKKIGFVPGLPSGTVGLEKGLEDHYCGYPGGRFHASVKDSARLAWVSKPRRRYRESRT